MDNSEREEDFITSVCDFRRWEDYAFEAKNAAVELKRISDNDDKKYLQIVLFLFATGLENYLKALICFKLTSKDLVKDGKFVFSHHNLKLLCEKAGISCDVEESALLELFRDIIEIWGRYPVPLTASKWRKPLTITSSASPQIMGGIPSLFIWSEGYYRIYSKIWIKIKEELMKK